MNHIKFWQRVPLPDGSLTPGVVVHGPPGEDWHSTRFGMPKDLSGKRVIEIGCSDGLFSFEAERRGAEYMLATDIEFWGEWQDRDAFWHIHKAWKSRVKFTHLDIEYRSLIMPLEMHPREFDLVMCFGVLYHLRAPLIAMENLSALTKPGGTCLIETATTEIKGCVLEYRPGYDGDPTNYFYPNHHWIRVAALQSGFKTCEIVYEEQTRSTYRLTR